MGLPERFTHWRPVQEAAVTFLDRSTKRIKAICVPTGGGKTAIAVGTALESQKPTCFVTDNRALQDQYLGLYSSVGMVDIRGRANYDCGLKADYTCEDGAAHRCPMKGTVKCPASQAEMRAAASYLVVTNYDKWIAARRFGQGLSHIQRVVFDEGHVMSEALSRAMQITLNHREFEEMLGVPFPDPSEAQFFSVWKPWAQAVRPVADAELASARRAMMGGNPRVGLIRHFLHLRNLVRRIAVLATAQIDNWIVEEVPKGYQFDPIFPGRYAESALLLRVPEIIVMSATLRPKTLYLCGIKKEAFDFAEFESDFDPKRCPIYYIPTMRVDQRSSHDLSMLWVRLDQIAAARRDRNGLVHTVSFTRRDEVLARSRFAGSMIVNEKGEPATWMIEKFVASYPGSILVSPSVGQGFDFARKAAEWQFICKIPFPPPSRVLKARTEHDAEYPYFLAMQKLVQMFGRLMRDEADSGESFIGDEHMDWFLPRYRHLAPKSFNQFFRRVDVLPQPPPRLT